MSALILLALAVAGAHPGGTVSGEARSPLIRGATVELQIEVSSGPALTEAARLPAARDAWLGSDKFTHIGMSFASTAFAFAAFSVVSDEPDAALAVAVPLGAAAGIGKEIADVRRGGAFSLKDLVADAIGVAAAWLILREVD